MPATQSVRKPSRVYLRRGHPLTRGLVNAWPFFAGAGSTLRDISGRNQHGAFGGSNNSPNWSTGNFGTAINFDDNNSEQIDVGDNDRIEGISELSIIGWMELDGDFTSPDGDDNMTLYSWGDSFGSYVHVGYQGDGGNVKANAFWVKCDNGNQDTDVYQSDTFRTGGVYKQVGLVFDADDDLYLVIDGQFDNNHGGTLPSTTPGGSDNHLIGNSPTIGKSHMSGIIDVILIYNRALRESECAALYHNPLAPFITKPR